MDNKRAHFRLEYPPPERPRLVLSDERAFEVLELSERGVRFDGHDMKSLRPGALFQGAVHFRDGQLFEVEGLVLRVEGERPYYVGQLSKGIPYWKMMEEHLSIIRRYQVRES